MTLKAFKKSRGLLLVLGATMLLASCEIIAKPNGYDEDKILKDIEIDQEQHNNMKAIIYDAFHDGSSYSTTVVNLVFGKVFDEQYGTFNDICDAYENNKSEELINAHEIYQSKKDDGSRDTSAEAKALELGRVKRVYTRMQSLISDKLMGELNSSTYKNDDGLFDEELFARSIYEKLYLLGPGMEYVDWNTFTSTPATYPLYNDVTTMKLILPDVELFDDETLTWSDQGLLHITSSGDNRYGYYEDYIVTSLLPDVKQHILTEDYIYAEEYNTLGSKFGRKVNYVKIDTNAAFNNKYATKATDLTYAFLDNHVLTGATTIDSDFKILETAWKGYNLAPVHTALLDAAGFKAVTLEITTDEIQALKSTNIASFIENYADDDGVHITYYEGTQFGNIVESFLLIKSNPFATDASQEKDFSGDNKYSYLEGFDKKVRTLLEADSTKDGWGTKNDGLTDLPSTIKDRLCTINVATNLPENGDVFEENQYLTQTPNGLMYLLPTKKQQGDKYAMLFRDGSSYYIVNVLEAASHAKLSKSANGIYSAEKREEVAYELCNILAKDSSKKTNALEWYLDNTDILYHDDDILEYFKNTYPNIFED